MLDNRITPVDDRRDHFCIPEEKASIAHTWVKEKAQANIVALALDAIDAAPLTAKADSFGFAHTDAIGRVICPACQCLCHGTVNVISDPGGTSTFRVLMQGVLRKVMLCAHMRKRLSSFLPVSTRNGTGFAPGRIVTHPPESLVGFSKQCVIQLPSSLQVSAQALLLAPVHAQGHFEEKRWGLRSLHGLLSLSLSFCMGCTCKSSRPLPSAQNDHIPARSAPFSPHRPVSRSHRGKTRFSRPTHPRISPVAGNVGHRRERGADHGKFEQVYYNQRLLSSLEKPSSIAPPPTPPKQGTAFHPPDGIAGAFKPDFL